MSRIIGLYQCMTIKKNSKVKLKMIVIRKAINEDIIEINKILLNIIPIMNRGGNFQWNSTYPNEEVFKNDILSDQLWVAEIDNSVAGFAAITTHQEPEYENVGWDISEIAIVTHRLAVDPKYQGSGVGLALLNKAEEVARERKIKFLRIDTNTNNEITKKLFPKCGYIYCGEIDLQFRPGLRFYCYQKIIE